MKNISVKRRYVTLIEMMIVMFLIALITGVIAYNYRGSLEEGKAFKTKAGIEKLETILNLEIAKNPGLKQEVTSQWKEMIRHSPLVHDARALETDGWGEDYHVYLNDDGVVQVDSKRFDEYRRTHNTSFSQ